MTIILLLVGNQSSDIAAGKPVTWRDAEMYCKAGDDTDGLALCKSMKDAKAVDESDESENIWEAMIKCGRQTQGTCNDKIARFKSQINDIKPAWDHNDIVHLDHYAALSDYTPLLAAVSSGSVKLTQALLCNGANPNLASDSKYTPLREVIEIIQLRTSENTNPIIVGTDSDWARGISRPMEKFPEIHHRPWGPSLNAKRADYIEIAKLLIASGADLISGDRDAETLDAETLLEYCDRCDRAKYGIKSDSEIRKILSDATEAQATKATSSR